jgi:hypothetical protein
VVSRIGIAMIGAALDCGRCRSNSCCDKQKPLIGKDTPVQLRSISYKGLLSPSGTSGLSSRIMIAELVD